MKFSISAALLLINMSSYCLPDGLAKNLSAITGTDTICKVWVWFNDKGSAKSDKISQRADLRRNLVNYRNNESDRSVSDEYIKKIESCGASLKHTFKWENCASFTAHASKLPEIARYPFVKKVTSVNKLVRGADISDNSLLKKTAINDSLYCGLSYNQLNMINVPAAHDYLKNNMGFSAPGHGVTIAFFDTGFRLDHKAFNWVRQNGQIKAAYDFIDNDTSVADPDSVNNNPRHPYYRNDLHGSMTLSLVAGYSPGEFMGAAWGAEFVLARTENTFWDSIKQVETEIHSEEDDWAAAVVWAESLGVDIISSSVGYSDGFQDSTLIQSNGSRRSIIDYEYSDLDGKTTVVSRAALGAIQRGVVIVNSIGNEGRYREGTLCAPADVDGVISVGALNINGSGIADFSSTGPTSDGRIKPDCVAQGVNVTVVDFSNEEKENSDAYAINNGTSFSTPLVAGVCALIMQAMSEKNSDAIRNALFASCKFLPDQIKKDNIYGNGLPDALNACKAVSPKKNLSPEFNVFPNYIRRGALRQVSVELRNCEENATAEVRILSVNGDLVWKSVMAANNRSSALTIWQCRNGNGKNVVPGLYYAVVEYKGSSFSQKILIAG